MPRRDFTKVPFAATGDVTSIPTAVQPDGSVSMAAGFGFDYQRDNGAGGGTPDPLAKSIPRDATNGILNEITASIGEIQLNGLAIWAASAAPYPINATVRHNNTNWRSTVANNSAQPGVAPLANWIDTTVQIVQATESVAGVMKIATQVLTNAGTNDDSAVTPKKLLAWFVGMQNTAAAWASTTVRGFISLATDTLISQGTDDTTAVTPVKMVRGLQMSLGATGYLVLPWWLGSIAFQWGSASAAPSTGGAAVTYPLAFANPPWAVLTGPGGSTPVGVVMQVSATERTRTGFILQTRTTTAGSSTIIASSYYAIGI